MQNINSAKAYNMNGWILLKCKMKKKFRKKKYRLCWKTNIASSCMQREQQNVKKNKVCNTCFPVFLILVLFYFLYFLCIVITRKKISFLPYCMHVHTYVCVSLWPAATCIWKQYIFSLIFPFILYFICDF